MHHTATCTGFALGLLTAAAHAAPIYGGPAYDSSTSTGFLNSNLPFAPGSTAGNGTAVGYANKCTAGANLGERAVRWDASGTAAAELGNLGADNSGNTSSQAYAVNTAGTVVGFATKYAAGTNLGERAVRWDASGTAATELGNLGTDSAGVTNSRAYAVNAAGTAVGYVEKYVGDGFFTSRAVRWGTSGTAVELGDFNTSSNGIPTTVAYAVNAAGTAVGYEEKYTSGTDVGSRAVRWDALGTAASELGNLGTDTAGNTRSLAYAVNTAGTAVGYATKYAAGKNLGNRAVRWEASGTAAIELGNLGTDSAGFTNSLAYAANTAGTAVGSANKYTAGTNLGQRAVRWDASGTAVYELGNLGTDGSGSTNSVAYAVNIAGTAVGTARKYDGDTDLGQRAVAWGLDGVAIDLNTLLSPSDAALWTLTRARSISDTNWVTGLGAFDPDGTAGPQTSYTRAFLIQVPEPSSLALLSLGGMVLARRRLKTA